MHTATRQLYSICNANRKHPWLLSRCTKGTIKARVHVYTCKPTIGTARKIPGLHYAIPKQEILQSSNIPSISQSSNQSINQSRKRSKRPCPGGVTSRLLPCLLRTQTARSLSSSDIKPCAPFSVSSRSRSPRRIPADLLVPACRKSPPTITFAG